MPDHINPGANVDWCSPNKVLDPVREFFDGTIDLDPCSNPSSIVGATVAYQLPTNDGLKDSWDICENRPTKVYDNPPFGRCYVRNDGEVVLSAKEWTKGRKLWKNQMLEANDAGSVPPGAITDLEAARFTSSSVIDWVRKAAAHFAAENAHTLTLIPASVDTATWQDVVFPTAPVVCWIKGRLSFLSGGKPIAPAPMACAVVGWVEDTDRFLKVFAKLGTCQRLR